MTDFWLLFRREIERRWTLLLAPVLIGLMVAVLPWFDVWHGAKPGDVRGVAAFVAALLWALTLAIGLGLADWPADLRAHRLTFDFRLPVRGGTIWAARATAAMVLTFLGSALILLLPSLFGSELKAAVESLNWMATGIQGLPYWTAAQFIALLAAGLVVLHLFVQVLAVSLNGHRVWAVVAGASLFAADLAVWLEWQKLGSWFAVAGQRRVAVLALLLAIVGLAASLVWQTMRGRSEPDRSQRALVPALVIASLAIMGLTLGYGSWFLHPPLSSVHKLAWNEGPPIWVSASATGNPTKDVLGDGWTLVSGSAWGRPGLMFSFVESSKDAKTVRLGPTLGFWMAYPRAALSADGSRLVWPEFRRGVRGAEATLYYLDTGKKGASPRRSLVALPGIDFPWALSPDGQRIVSVSFRGSRDRLLYDEVDSGKRLKILPLPGVLVQTLKFTSADRLKAFGWTRGELAGRRKKHPFTIDLHDGSIHAVGTNRSAPLEAAPSCKSNGT